MPTTDELAAQIAELRDRLDEQSGLRASQDRDLSTIAANLAAQKHLIQSLAITSSQHNDQINRLRLEHGERLDRIEGKLGHVERGIDAIAEMLTTLIDRDR